MLFGKPLIKYLVRTPITPNMVTFFNLFVIFPMFCLANLKKMYLLVAVLVQLYMFFDVVDGNLARNKNMKSELGRRLDIIADTIFYTLGVFVMGLSMDLELWKVCILIVVQQVYGCIATYYIVPKIRKLSNFRHTNLKQFFISHDILFGMDASLECLIFTVFLPFSIRKVIFIVCPIMWIVDLIYRLYELEYINK